MPTIRSKVLPLLLVCCLVFIGIGAYFVFSSIKQSNQLAIGIEETMEGVENSAEMLDQVADVSVVQVGQDPDSLTLEGSLEMGTLQEMQSAPDDVNNIVDSSELSGLDGEAVPNTQADAQMSASVQPAQGGIAESSDPNVGLSLADYYKEYSQTSLDLALGENKRIVLFFYATWDPYSRNIEKHVRENLYRLPLNVMILRANFDVQKSLREKHGINIPHTFVLINNQQESLKTWNSTTFENFLIELN